MKKSSAISASDKFQLQLSFLVKYLSIGAFLITIGIFGSTNYDPIGVPKLYILSFFSFSGLGIYLIQNHGLQFNRFRNIRKYDLAIIAFIALLILNVAINHQMIDERLFGVSSRNTGLITLLGFIIYALLFSRTHSGSQIKFVLQTMFWASFVVSIYFIFQLAGMDIFLIDNYYGAPSSTLGNPNFVSGFIGFSALTPLALYSVTKRRFWFATSILMIPLHLFVIIKTNSIQGIFAFATTCVVGMFIFISKRYRKTTIPLLILLAIGFMLILLGIMDKGPLASILHKSSLFSRFDYWRAAISMTLHRPFFGVGMDAFGDYYPKFRDIDAFNRFAGSQSSDTPHNVPLDYFASGGIPLGLLFLFIQVMPIIFLIREQLKTSEIKFERLALISLFAGYFTQSLVSPNQIGVSIWGWILSALSFSLVSPNDLRNMKMVRSSVNLTLGLIFILLSPFISLPPLLKDHQFLVAAKKADGQQIIAIAQSWPRDTKRFIMTESGLTNGGYHALAKKVILKALDHNPNSFALWKALKENKVSTLVEIQRAYKEMSRLDPLWKEKN